MTPDHDIAIVGYGPVGQLLAILLGQRGWRVCVLERWPVPYPLPRAVHFDHEIGRVLQAAGVAEVLVGRTEPAHVYEWRNAAGQTLLRIGREEGGPSGWPESNMFCQPELEGVLDERVRSLGCVEVRRGCEVVGIDARADGVVLHAKREGGESVLVGTRYAVGCDGANSFVRQQMGAAWHDEGFRFDWLVVDVIPDEIRVWDPLNLQVCDPVRPTTLVSGGPGRRRWEFMRLPDETIRELDREETAWRLLAPWDVRPENASLERHAVYTFRAGWAESWRRSRVLLAGDAAHLMPPFAGQGMCSGMRDAANLAWKLDLVLAGRAPDALLDTYPSERLPHVRAVIGLSIALGRVICVADPDEAAERDRRMATEQHERSAPIASELPPLGPGCFAEGDAARRLFVQGRVRRGEVEGLFDDVVGGGFALVSPHGDPAAHLPPDLAGYFASLGGVTAHVAPEAPVADLTGAYARWFAATGAAVALQRPDFAVFGTAPTLEGTAGLVSALRDRLSG